MCTDLKPCTQVTSSPPPSLLGSFTLGYPQGHTHPSWPSHVLCNRKNDQFKNDKLLHFCQHSNSFFSSQHPTHPPKWNRSNVTWQQCPLEECFSNCNGALYVLLAAPVPSITLALLPTWLRHCTHQQEEFMFFHRQLGWACDYGGSDVMWLSYLLPGSQPWSPELPVM